jgi:anhydro-N-acetylmuramic acid kinase
VSIDYGFETKILLKAAEYSIRKTKGNWVAASEHFEQDLKEYLVKQLSLCATTTMRKLLAFLGKSGTTISLDDIQRHSARLHIECVNQLLHKTKHEANEIEVIGYHGQTIYHSPEQKISFTLADPQEMADQLGIKVVHDFRTNDVLAGGQGAPFAPIYHYALAMRDRKAPIGIVNCGGISNITVIPSSNLDEMHAFDTGPGNGLVDLYMRQMTHGKESMDLDGHYGSVGVVCKKTLDALYNKAIIKNDQNYLTMMPPKSLDIGDMHLIPEVMDLNINDACATLETFTAITIVDALKRLPSTVKLPNRWVVSGGGWKNPVIRRAFDSELSKVLGNNIILLTANDIGWNGDAMEAQIFAYLALRSLEGKPLSLPNTTGVSEPMTGGVCYTPRADVRAGAVV